MAERLTTDNPKNNTETMLNYAYAKDKQVYLRYGDGEENISLCEYISRLAANKSCQPTPEEVLDGECMECDCELAVLYWVAVQAAELRGRLAAYEDLGSVEDCTNLKDQSECDKHNIQAMKQTLYQQYINSLKMLSEKDNELAALKQQIADGKLVEIVRCGECKFKGTDDCACSYYAFDIETLKHELNFTQDDKSFSCGYGERRGK